MEKKRDKRMDSKDNKGTTTEEKTIIQKYKDIFHFILIIY